MNSQSFSDGIQTVMNSPYKLLLVKSPMFIQGLVLGLLHDSDSKLTTEQMLQAVNNWAHTVQQMKIEDDQQIIRMWSHGLPVYLKTYQMVQNISSMEVDDADDIENDHSNYPDNLHIESKKKADLDEDQKLIDVIEQISPSYGDPISQIVSECEPTPKNDTQLVNVSAIVNSE